MRTRELYSAMEGNSETPDYRTSLIHYHPQITPPSPPGSPKSIPWLQESMRLIREGKTQTRTKESTAKRPNPFLTSDGGNTKVRYADFNQPRIP